jgi:hypothetical protein
MIKIYFVFLILLIASQVVLSQEVPTVEDLNIDDVIGESQNTLDSIPNSLDDDLIPNETATQLFSYMKWFFSDTSARELAGDTLAPILINLYLYLFIAFTFATLWLTIRMLVLGWRLTLFIVGWIIRLLELIPFIQ